MEGSIYKSSNILGPGNDFKKGEKMIWRPVFMMLKLLPQ